MSKYTHTQEFNIDKDFFVGTTLYYISADIEVGYDRNGDLIDNSLEVQRLHFYNHTYETEMTDIFFAGDRVIIDGDKPLTDAVNSLLWQEAIAFTENNWELISEAIGDDLADGGDL
jgi:hypothetical protein